MLTKSIKLSQIEIMKTVNIHEAKTHLSRLIEAAANGEPFIIAKAGKPLVRVEALTEAPPRRTGFLKGAVEIPENFDEMGVDQIQALFEK